MKRDATLPHEAATLLLLGGGLATCVLATAPTTEAWVGLVVGRRGRAGLGWRGHVYGQPEVLKDPHGGGQGLRRALLAAVRVTRRGVRPWRLGHGCRRTRHDGGSPRGAGREHTLVEHQIHPRARH